MKKITIVFAAIFLLAIFSSCAKTDSSYDLSTLNSLYQDAVIDAMVADNDEIQELVSLNFSDEMTTWKDDEVLLVTWHKYPESYPKGEKVTLKYGSIWTFTDKEITSWYKDNKDDFSDTQIRLNQLIGLSPTDDNTHFTAVWVNPDDVLRPAYINNPLESTMKVENFEMDETFKEWFDGNIINSYYSEWKYPWTRLGYTYDWAENGEEYGLTEFLIKENSEVTVEYTLTTDEFLAFMNEQISN